MTRSTDTLQNISYIYDPEGNITEIEDTAQQTIYFNGSVVEPKSLYEYDALYRLKKATGREHNSLANISNNDFVNIIIRPEDGTNMRNYTQEYKYDEIGNITEMKSNGVWTREYKYNFDVNPNNNNYLLNHDSQSTTDTYLYDAHGNMTKMPHLPEMKYDYADQLNEVTLDASGNKAYYVYDANGDRVRKVVVKNTGTIVEDRFYIGDYEIYSKKTNGTLDTERETLHIIDDKSKLALIDYDTQNSTTTIRYQYTNHLDSASLELDETGDIISYEEYHPFGTTSYRSGRNEIDVSLKRYKYVHKELDNETGLYYYGLRFYAPWIARFISVDPLQFKYPELTPFQYASNCPISYNDLDGAEANKVPDNLKGIMLKRMGVIKQVGPTVENAKQMEEMKMTQTFSEVNQYHIKKTGTTIGEVTSNQKTETIREVTVMNEYRKKWEQSVDPYFQTEIESSPVLTPVATGAFVGMNMVGGEASFIESYLGEKSLLKLYVARFSIGALRDFAGQGTANLLTGKGFLEQDYSDVLFSGVENMILPGTSGKMKPFVQGTFDFLRADFDLTYSNEIGFDINSFTMGSKKETDFGWDFLSGSALNAPGLSKFKILKKLTPFNTQLEAFSRNIKHSPVIEKPINDLYQRYIKSKTKEFIDTLGVK